MKEYTVQIKEMQRPTVISILGFLADVDYFPDAANSSDHRTETLCYIGKLDEIHIAVMRCNDIVKVVDTEIENFYKLFEPAIERLNKIGTPEQMLSMLFKIESFIRDAITSRYD